MNRRWPVSEFLEPARAAPPLQLGIMDILGLMPRVHRILLTFSNLHRKHLKNLKSQPTKECQALECLKNLSMLLFLIPQFLPGAKKIHQMTHLNVSYEPIQFTANFHRCDNFKIVVINILKNKFSKLLGSKLNMK